MNLRLTVVALLLLASRANAQDDCLPFKVGDGGSPVIEALVNDRGPFQFVLDTAASGATLDGDVIGRLGLVRDVATEQAQGMGGSQDVHLYQVASITAGPVALRDTVVPELPAPEFESHDIAGLAGVDLFGDRLAVWRPERQCVDVSESGEQPAGDGWVLIDAVWTRPWKIMLPVRIGGVDGFALLDTGSQHSVLNPPFAALLGLVEESGRLQPDGEIFGIDGRPLPLSRGEVTDVAIGVWRWSERDLMVGDLPVFARLGDADAPLMILGMDWLSGQAFAIDYGDQRVWLRSR